MDDRLTQLQGYLESKQWDKAWDEFQRIQGEGPPSARMLLMGSHASYGRRDYFRARHLADEAMAARNPSDPPAILGKIRFHLGMVARRAGDSHVALEQFQLFISELSAKYPELVMAEGKAYYYLALTLRERRDMVGAVAAYRQAIDWFRREQINSLLCMCLQNLAWLFCHMQRSQEASECLEEASQLLTSDELRIHQTLGEAFLASIEERHTVAAALCESLFRRVERGEPVTLEEQAQAAWIVSSSALAQDNLVAAAALADVALTYATEAKDPRLMNDANLLRRTIYVRRQAGA
jgi:tetratricopeptide (TPR) repeat protein